MRPSLLIPFLGVILSTLINCNPSNSRRMTAPEKTRKASLTHEASALKTSNALDILFVIDNSETMAVHQANLAANIQHFVKAFEKNTNVDYHLGVVPIFDSIRYGSVITQFNPNGFLLPLKGDVGDKPKYFYTRDHNDSALLARSINIGVLPLKDKDGKYQGPEFEEVLSPIYAAFTEPALSSPTNKGFFRPEARLAIIIITDADDVSPGLSGSDLDFFLRSLKKDPAGEKISTFGVLANANECSKVDYGMLQIGKPVQILDFIEASGGSVLSLCQDNFADMLARIGKQIEEKVPRQYVPLQGVPEIGTLKVLIGGKELNAGPSTWSYDPAQNMIVIRFIPKSAKMEDRTIAIEYTRVNMENVKNGRAQKYGDQR